MLGFKSIDRATKQLIKTIPFSNENHIANQISKLWIDHKSLKYSSHEVRSNNLINFHELLKDNKEDFARIINKEMGKTLDEARGEINRCMLHTKYYANDISNWTKAKKKKILFQKINLCT